MPAARVVPALDEVEDGDAGRGLRREALAIEQLALERREEAFAEGVVVGIAHRPHRGPAAGRATAEPEGNRGVLAALVRVMDDVGRPALLDGQVQSRQDERGAQMRFHRPADHAPTPRVDHDGEVQKPGRGWDVRDVRHPQPVGPGAAKSRATRSGAGRCAWSRSVVRGRLRRLTSALTPAEGPHEPGHPLAADMDPQGGEFRMHPRRPVGAL